MSSKKTNRREPRRDGSALRTFQLHARFTPEGPDPEEGRQFALFWIEAKTRAQELRAAELARKERQLKAFVAAEEKTRPILLKALRDEIPAETAVKRIRRAVPDKRLARELFDHWGKAMAGPPDHQPRSTEEIAREEADIRRLDQIHKANKAIHGGFAKLMEAAVAGDEDAAKALLESALSGVQWVTLAERCQPEVFRNIARWQTRWPVAASDESGWEEKAAQRIAGLKLGLDLRGLKTRFRQARGPDSSHPARQWAKAAVRVIEETRGRFLAFGTLTKSFGSLEAFTDFTIEKGWNFAPDARWPEALKALPPFSQESLAAWKRAIRQMIREEMSDFHTAAEWSNQRNAAVASGRDSRGEIQNAILDDICSALARLAPEKAC